MAFRDAKVLIWYISLAKCLQKIYLSGIVKSAKRSFDSEQSFQEIGTSDENLNSVFVVNGVIKDLANFTFLQFFFQ